MDNNFQIEDGSTIGRNVVLGHNVIVESNCHIGDNV